MTEKITRYASKLPLIDISPLFADDPCGMEVVKNELRAACEERGFFYITNHRVSEALIERVFAFTRAFFEQSNDSKNALHKSFSSCNRGYEPLKTQTLEAGAPPDLKESFYLGADVPLDDPRVLVGRFNTGPNQWPANLPGFKETMGEYYSVAYELASKLMVALAGALELSPDYFDRYLDGASATLRLLHYPPQPPNPAPREKGCGEHTDFGGLTLLLQDNSGGLQVHDAGQGRWIDAPPIAGTYVINIGDLLQRWTNGRFHSTLHRVVNVSGRERHSVPFFFTGNPLHVVECLSTCLQPGEKPKFAPVTIEEHLKACYLRTYR
jgi:isopenicillin N synthase-like dioxygenase